MQKISEILFPWSVEEPDLVSLPDIHSVNKEGTSISADLNILVNFLVFLCYL